MPFTTVTVGVVFTDTVRSLVLFVVASSHVYAGVPSPPLTVVVHVTDVPFATGPTGLAAQVTVKAMILAAVQVRFAVVSPLVTATVGEYVCVVIE